MTNRIKSVKPFLKNIFFLSLLVAPILACGEGGVDSTQGYRDELLREPEPYRGPSRSGKVVYRNYCKTCHDRSTQGAPMPGDRIDWQLRVQKGVERLMDHTISGYKQLLMPPRGGCRTCSDEELWAAINYMLEKSQIHIEKEPAGF